MKDLRKLKPCQVADIMLKNKYIIEDLIEIGRYQKTKEERELEKNLVSH